MKRIFSVAVLLVLLCTLSACKEETFTADSSDPPQKDNYFQEEQDHKNEQATVTANAVYWEDDGAIYHCSLEGGKKTEIAKGRLICAAGDHIFYDDGKLWAYNGQKTVAIEAEYYIGTTEKEVLFRDEDTLYLFDREDPAQKREYPVSGLEYYATLQGDSLYWFGKNALQKTDLQSGKTEALQDLGYIGTAVPSFYWLGEQLYFYYGYTVYRCEKDQVTALVTYKENTPCVFGNGYAYAAGQILDLVSGSAVRTLDATGFAANEWGVAYRTDTHIVIAAEEELLIPIPEGTDLIGFCYATPNGVLVNSAKNFIRVYRDDDGDWSFSHL